jgi:hypothetical protein
MAWTIFTITVSPINEKNTKAQYSIIIIIKVHIIYDGLINNLKTIKTIKQ